MLTIRSTGNDIVLDWTPSPSHPTTYVYRSMTYGGAYTRIGSAQGSTFTDTGVLTNNQRAYYYLTQDRGVISNFRMPAMGTPNRE
jgi:hypothetical protein